MPGSRIDPITRERVIVLIIDDDERVLASTRASLEEQGVVVEMASSGSRASEALHGGPFDLVVLDIASSDASGWEVLQRIRASSDVIVMMLHSRGTDVDAARGATSGGGSYCRRHIDGAGPTSLRSAPPARSDRRPAPGARGCPGAPAGCGQCSSELPSR
jgi:CheY-like chemotaxis protein